MNRCPHCGKSIRGNWCHSCGKPPFSGAKPAKHSTKNIRGNGSREEAGLDREGSAPKRTKQFVMTTVASLLLLGAIIGGNFQSDVQEVHVKAFGSKPFGLPVIMVVTIVELLLFIPVPYFLFHASFVVTHHIDRGEAGRGLSWLFSFLLAARSARDPELKYSARIAVGGLVYCLAIGVAWIMYAYHRGI